MSVKLRLVIAFAFAACLSQAQTKNLYYKSLTDSIVQTFKSDSSGIEIKETDPLYKYKAYFDYVHLMHSKVEYKKLIISSGKSKKLADVKTKGFAAIASSENRVYTIRFSTKAPSLIDTITFEKLSTDAKIAFISKQFSMVHEYGTCGFFEVIGMHFKKRSKSSAKELNKDNNLRSIEAGLGHQMIAYTLEVFDKIQEENWKDKKAFKKYYNHYTKDIMSYDEIKTYMSDYPVYMQSYK